MYSFRFTILPIEAGISSSKAKIVLAPRGMLHQGALQYKRMKKKLYFNLFRIRGLHKKIVFHATDVTEREDVKKVFGKNVNIEFVKDFPSSRQGPLQVIEKEPGYLKCIFVSRISPKKNLLFLLSVLSTVKAEVQLSIAGPVEDDPYWLTCRDLITSMPANIKVEYLGAIPNNELPAIYRQHHLFVLPTHGENFGHVIFEALLNGRPVLISDHTPWRNLEEKETGWDLPLSGKEKFKEKIELAAGWNQQLFNRHCDASWHFAQSYISGSGLKQQYLKLFS
jgi:glycosyltransferase involved in cell wall biosynthesis